MYSVAAVFLLLVRERQITPGLVLVAQLSLPTLGFAILQDRNGEVPGGWLVLAAPLVIAAGMALGPHRKVSNEYVHVSSGLSQFLVHAFWLLSVLAVLHFALGGIPVFSANVETERFNLGSSGLGGLPSRAVLYAIPIVALLSLSTLTEVTKRQTSAIWVLYIVTQLGLGFKGAVVEVLVIAAIAYLIRFKRPRARHVFLFGLSLVMALAYVEIVRSLYATTSKGGPGGVGYILDRATTQAIESGYLALLYSPDFAGAASVYLHDFKQLLSRYLGASDNGDYTFDMLMSSIVTGTPLGMGMFIVPVTVGGTVYLMFSLPAPLAVGVLIVIGYVWSWAVASFHGETTVIRLILAGTLIIGLRLFVLNGNGAYLTINLLFSLFLLWICAWPALGIGRSNRLDDSTGMSTLARERRIFHGSL